MKVDFQMCGPAVPVRPARGPDGTRPSSDIMSAPAVAVGVACAPDGRRAHEVCARRAVEFPRTCTSGGCLSVRLTLKPRQSIGTISTQWGLCLFNGLPWLWPVQPNNCLKRFYTASTTDVKQQVKVGARAGGTAPVSGAHVMAGLGSVPVGRWQGPGRDCWSRRCGRSGEAREARFGINLW